MHTLLTHLFLPISAFAPLFRECTWSHVRTLLLGTILTPGVHTVTSGRRVLGPAYKRRCVNYHRVLSR